MIMWTVQPMVVYQQLLREGTFHCDAQQSWGINDDEFGPAYQWMMDQMTTKIAPAPIGVTAPLWAWYRREWQHKRPDFRYYYIGEKDAVCLEIEVPESQVLLSDFELWHFVLNASFLPKDVHSDEDYDRQSDWFQDLSERRQQTVMKRSWQRIFEVDPHHGPWGSGEDIQGCFWELKAEQVRHVLRIRKGHRMEQLL